MDKLTAESLQKQCEGATVQKLKTIDLGIAINAIDKTKPGRKRKWKNEAERLKAYRERKKAK